MIDFVTASRGLSSVRIPHDMRMVTVYGLLAAQAVLVASAAHAQNLVPNPSFESYTTCPNAPSQITLAVPWVTPTTGSPDYFNACDITPNNFGVPVNSFGNEPAHSGNGYAGIRIYTPVPHDNYREYLEVPLTSPLVAAGIYEVSFYASLADPFKYAIENLDAYLSVGVVGPFATSVNLSLTPQVTNPTGIINNKSGWRQVSGLYTAIGGERYLVIGNFRDDATTNNQNVGGICCSYYFIDDVSVKRVSCTPAPPDMVAWYTGDDTTPRDLLGQHNGAYLGFPVSSVDWIVGGGALEFHSPDTYVQVPDHNDLDFGTGSFSIDMWIKTAAGVPAPTIQPILDKRTATPLQGYHMAIANGNLLFQLADGVAVRNYTSALPVPNDANWHFIAVTVDRGAQNLTMYVDGNSQLFSTSQVTGSLSNAANLLIGARQPSLGLLVFNGLMDEIEIFSRALPIPEVESIYLAGSAGKCKTCEPLPDGTGCRGNCPNDPSRTCKPTEFVQDLINGGERVTKCGCVNADECSIAHAQPSSPGVFFCQGVICPGTTQHCQLTATQNPDSTITYDCCQTAPPTISCDACCGKKPNFLSAFGSSAIITVDPGNVNVVVAFDITNQPLPNWSNWFATPFTPSGSQDWTGANLGSVFGITLDDQGNIFVAHTTIYGDLISQSMDALGALGGGFPTAAGAIYKINTTTGIPSLFKQLPNNVIANCGGAGSPGCGPAPEGCFPGLGNLNFSCAHQMIYVSNFEDGHIYRLDPANGNILSTWHHATSTITVGLPPPDSNGFPPLMSAGRAQRVWAVQVNDGRLYYSTWREDFDHFNPTVCTRVDPLYNNEIWSVALTPAGEFIPNSERLELVMPSYTGLNHPGTCGNAWSNPVSDISFSPGSANRCCMLLAQRSMSGDCRSSAHVSQLLEFCRDPNTGGWVPGANLQTGTNQFNAQQSSAGGDDYDHRSSGTNVSVWGTADAIKYPPDPLNFDPCGSYVYGLIGLPATGGTPSTNALMIDADSNVCSGDKFRLGDVEITCPRPVLPCDPLPPGEFGCDTTICPNETQRCIPTLVHDDPCEPPLSVEECNCKGPNQCHLTQGPDGWACVGKCPASHFPHRCVLRKDDTNGDGVDDEFSCSCDPIVVDPVELDIDHDGDVDLFDYALFQNGFKGPSPDNE